MAALISVCIPTYNGESYLAECLDSLLSQSFTDFEVLIVDDNSTDRTALIASRYVQADPRFRLVQNTRRLGLVGNWNRCLELATGEWIKFLFQDDYLEPECLQIMLEALKTTGARFAFCRREIRYQGEVDKQYLESYQHHQFVQEMILGKRSLFPAEEFASLVMQSLVKDSIINLIGEPTTTMFHKSIVNDYGMFDPIFIQLCDAEYWLRVCAYENIAHVSRPLACFRVHSQSTTNRNKLSNTLKNDYLEQLIIFHRIFFHEAYRPLKTTLPWFGSKLMAIYGMRACRAWDFVYNNENGPAGVQSQELIAEWRNMVKDYPELYVFSILCAPIRVILNVNKSVRSLFR